MRRPVGRPIETAGSAARPADRQQPTDDEEGGLMHEMNGDGEGPGMGIKAPILRLVKQLTYILRTGKLPNWQRVKL